MYNLLVFISSLILVVNAQYGVVPVGGRDDITGLIGQDYTLQCEQTLRLSSSDPAPDITWSFDDDDDVDDAVQLENGAKYSISEEKNETAKYTISTLIVRNAQFADEGDYRCTGDSGGTTIGLDLSVDAEVRIESDRDDFLLAEGLVLTCSLGDAVNDTTERIWKYKRDADEDKPWKVLTDGDQDVNGEGPKEVRVSSNTVTLLTSDPAAAGTYQCSVTIKGSTQSDEVIVSGILEVRAPQSVKASEHEVAVIRCEASSVPRPKIIWAYNNTVIENSTDKYEMKPINLGDQNQVISELHVLNITITDGKYTNYTCTGKIGDEEEVREIIIRIRDPLAALWPFIGIVSEVAILIVIILIHEACTKEDIGETDDDEEDTLLQKDKTITRDGEQTRMRGTNN